MSLSGAIVESAASGAGGASAYGAIVASAKSGVDAGAAAQQWQHRRGNPSQIRSHRAEVQEIWEAEEELSGARRSTPRTVPTPARQRQQLTIGALPCVFVGVCACGWRVARTPSCRARTLSSRAVRLTHKFNPSSSCSSPCAVCV